MSKCQISNRREFYYSHTASAKSTYKNRHICKTADLSRPHTNKRDLRCCKITPNKVNENHCPFLRKKVIDQMDSEISVQLKLTLANLASLQPPEIRQPNASAPVPTAPQMPRPSSTPLGSPRRHMGRPIMQELSELHSIQSLEVLKLNVFQWLRIWMSTLAMTPHRRKTNKFLKMVQMSRKLKSSRIPPAKGRG